MKQEQQEITTDFLGAHCKVTGLQYDSPSGTLGKSIFFFRTTTV